ncbi:type II toxin-antitoxin system VapC family toxin [Prosthecobacter dejongeii]|uniref:Putative nucleic acid-binding protein n=1 Tax=Prosthecobacter dejongeii TaxID=48465 RepID=A0A7W7YM81_9BACT|nr:PIN domain-containing protein [Prosthecobacter dejongeii]MBB5038550.1 putative nucleic acid-binding protein [Prosthecobacter dejongeii]
MINGLLVDSSFYIDRLRQGRDPLHDLAALSEDWEILTCGVIMVEVCRGFREAKARDRFHEAFSTMIILPTTPKLWQKVMELAWHMDRQGKPMQVTDLTIAASALAVNACLLTKDSDFSRVPGLQILTDLPQ